MQRENIQMKKWLLFTFCLFPIFIKSVAAQFITFNKNYDNATELLFNILPLPNGGYMANMSSYFSLDGKFIGILKVNNYGNIVYLKKYGLSNELNISYSFIETIDGNYITGCYSYFYDTKEHNCYLMKVDANGDSIWKKNIHAPSGFGFYSTYVTETANGELVITGQRCDTLNPYPADCDILILKTDSAGNELWHKSFGGSEYDAAYSVVETPDKGFLCLGWTRSFGFSNSQNRDIYLVKTDSLGNLEWQKTFGNANHETGIGITKTADGNYLLAGSTYNFTASSMQSNIIKIDDFGDIIWYGNYGFNPSNELWWAREVPTTNHIVAVGSRLQPNGTDDGWIIKTDSSGNQIWERAYRKHNDGSYFRDVQPTGDGGFICAGFVVTGDFGNQDGWLVKLDSAGCLNWSCGVLTDVMDMDGQQTNRSIFIYPNPAREVIIVSTKNLLDDYFQIIIYDNTAKEVLNKSFPVIPGQTWPVNINGLSKGLYLIKAGTVNHWETLKLMVE